MVYYSPAMVRALPDDGKRYETIQGRLLVTPAPRYRHQFVVGDLHIALYNYCRITRIGRVVMSPADVSLTADSLVQPDLFVIPPVPHNDMDWRDLGRPLLIAEILSPSTARVDRITKRRHYQRAGIPVYWIVDPVRRLVEVWTPDATMPVVEETRLRWAPLPSELPLEIDLGRLFE